MNRYIFVFLIFLITPFASLAQSKVHNPYSDKTPVYGNQKQIDPVPTAPPTPPAPIPIDGGVGFLIVAGIGYGIRELRKKD